MKDPVWDALFVAAYQSTDETDDAEGIDPETESEEPAVSFPSRPWVACLPIYWAAVVSVHSIILLSPDVTYHAPQVADAFGQLNSLVKTCRIEMKSKDIKSHIGQPHARRLRVSEPKEKPLPYPGKGDLIHLDLIDPTWLATSIPKVHHVG